MSDQWFYRMFGQDFGPIDFEELKLLAQQGVLSSSDEVRALNSSDWVSAGSVGELHLGGSASTATAVLPAPIAPAASTAADDWFCQFHGQELGPLGFEELVAFAEQGQLAADDEVKLGATGKWRRVGSIGRLVAVLPYNAVEAKPEPKKQSSPVISTVAQPAPKPEPRPQPVRQPEPVAPAPDLAAQNAAVVAAAAAATAAVAAIAAAHAELGKAQASYTTSDQSASHDAVGTGSQCRSELVGLDRGAEYGPVGFMQIFELGVSGRLQTTDFLKNGMYGQYLPANNLPGLFTAISIMKQAAAELLAAKEKVAEATAQAARLAPTPAPVAAAPAPVAAPPAPQPAPKVPSAANIASPTPPAAPAEASKPASPVRRSDAEVAAPAKPAEAPKPAAPSSAAVSIPLSPPPPPPPPRPSAPSMNTSSGYGSPAPRPAAWPPRPAYKPPKSGSSFSVGDLFKGPKAIGIAAVAVVDLLVVGVMFMPGTVSKAADIAKYRELKKFLDDVKAARAAKQDMSGFKGRADKLVAEYVPILKTEASTEYPAKQNLLWAVRDELPRMMNFVPPGGGAPLAEESVHEKAFAARLKAAGDKLGVN